MSFICGLGILVHVMFWRRVVLLLFDLGAVFT